MDDRRATDLAKSLSILLLSTSVVLVFMRSTASNSTSPVACHRQCTRTSSRPVSTPTHSARLFLQHQPFSTTALDGGRRSFSVGVCKTEAHAGRGCGYGTVSPYRVGESSFRGGNGGEYVLGRRGRAASCVGVGRSCNFSSALVPPHHRLAHPSILTHALPAIHTTTPGAAHAPALASLAASARFSPLRSPSLHPSCTDRQMLVNRCRARSQAPSRDSSSSVRLDLGSGRRHPQASKYEYCFMPVLRRLVLASRFQDSTAADVCSTLTLATSPRARRRRPSFVYGSSHGSPRRAPSGHASRAIRVEPSRGKPRAANAEGRGVHPSYVL
ncbi:hypothetical protein MSAN_01539600 [Mycena sanguinolenta]|uniref:Uncharacterized protein n=1 Tax=Mycena sanguinolenta TaxID=230812 RepID=A0A8H7CX28_9AGAR|nr:hypothetical protein MSAN_01539600 [Mycena sanguinolenta]